MGKVVTLMPLGGKYFYVQEVNFGQPDQGLPGSPNYPDQGLPGSPGVPSQPLPPSWPNYPTTGPVWPGKPVDPGYGIRPGRVWWPVDPDYGIPERPARPDNSLPTIPGVPDNSLPVTPPPTVPAGKWLIMVRTPDGKWHWALVDSMPTPLPEPPPTAQPKS